MVGRIEPDLGAGVVEPARLAHQFQRRGIAQGLDTLDDKAPHIAIAARAGSPAAVRAAGAAIGRNPVSIIVPCHRVLGRDGSLTGYAGGLERKRALLQYEGLPLP